MRTGRGLPLAAPGKTAAEVYVAELLKRGSLFPKQDPTLEEYTADWWRWDKCRYVAGRRARGERISRTYVQSCRGYLDHHILPSLGKFRISAIKPRVIEDWLMSLPKKKASHGGLLSPSTCNQILATLKLIFKEGVRIGDFSFDPTATIQPLKETQKRKPFLNPEEIKRLFDESKIQEQWEGNLKHYTINLLAASTGMRLRECQALQNQYVHEGYISVECSWDRKYGLGRTQILVPTINPCTVEDTVVHSRIGNDVALSGSGRFRVLGQLSREADQPAQRAQVFVCSPGKDRDLWGGTKGSQCHVPLLAAFLQQLFSHKDPRRKATTHYWPPHARNDGMVHQIYDRRFSGCIKNTGGVLQVKHDIYGFSYEKIIKHSEGIKDDDEKLIYLRWVYKEYLNTEDYYHAKYPKYERLCKNFSENPGIYRIQSSGNMYSKDSLTQYKKASFVVNRLIGNKINREIQFLEASLRIKQKYSISTPNQSVDKQSAILQQDTWMHDAIGKLENFERFLNLLKDAKCISQDSAKNYKEIYYNHFSGDVAECGRGPKNKILIVGGPRNHFDGGGPYLSEGSSRSIRADDATYRSSPPEIQTNRGAYFEGVV